MGLAAARRQPWVRRGQTDPEHRSYCFEEELGARVPAASRGRGCPVPTVARKGCACPCEAGMKLEQLRAAGCDRAVETSSAHPCRRLPCATPRRIRRSRSHVKVPLLLAHKDRRRRACAPPAIQKCCYQENRKSVSSLCTLRLSYQGGWEALALLRVGRGGLCAGRWDARSHIRAACTERQEGSEKFLPARRPGSSAGPWPASTPPRPHPCSLWSPQRSLSASHCSFLFRKYQLGCPVLCEQGWPGPLPSHYNRPLPAALRARPVSKKVVEEKTGSKCLVPGCPCPLSAVSSCTASLAQQLCPRAGEMH